jgi:hypothetical protein
MTNNKKPNGMTKTFDRLKRQLFGHGYILQHMGNATKVIEVLCEYIDALRLEVRAIKTLAPRVDALEQQIQGARGENTDES